MKLGRRQRRRDHLAGTPGHRGPQGVWAMDAQRASGFDSPRYTRAMPSSALQCPSSSREEAACVRLQGKAKKPELVW